MDMLIVDEAQHDVTMSMANLHCPLRPKKVLRLTATPFRTDRIKLCFDKVIRDAGIHQLIQDGYLSRYHDFTIPEYSPATVAEFLIQDPERWSKSLVFFHRQDQCDARWQVLAAAGLARRSRYGEDRSGATTRGLRSGPDSRPDQHADSHRGL